MTMPSVAQVIAHAAVHPFADGGGLWRVARDGGVMLWPLRAYDGRVQELSINGSYWGAPPTGCQWDPCDKNGNPVALLAERDHLAARVADFEAIAAEAHQDSYDSNASINGLNVERSNLLQRNEKLTARVKQLEDILHDMADEVRAQRSEAAYQRSHGQQATSGRRRIDLESYLARAGIEVAP